MTAVRTPLRSTALRRSAPVARPRRAGGPVPLTLATAPASTRQLRTVWVVGVIVVLAAVLVVMGSQALLVQGQDRLDELQRSLTEQQRIAERQQLQLAELQSPERVVAAATGRLGMVAPSDVVHLRSDPADDAAIAGASPTPAVDASEVPAPEAGTGSDTEAGDVAPPSGSDELASGDLPAAAGG